MTGYRSAAAGNVGGGVLDNQPHRAGLSLLFAAGERPSASEIERLLESDDSAGSGARVTHRPDDDGTGWLELLASGLTFDLTGLAPAAGSAVPEARQRFGNCPEGAESSCEAIMLAPGPHIAAGRAMMPVVRTMTGLAASLALRLPVKAVCWHPASTWMEPDYFTRIIVNWLSGGPFPALGLTAVEPVGENGVASVGLDFFSGQEVQVAATAGERSAETVKLAVRVIDYLVKEGPLQSLQQLQGPAGEPLLAEPSHDGRHVRVWRGT